MVKFPEYLNMEGKQHVDLATTVQQLEEELKRTYEEASKAALELNSQMMEQVRQFQIANEELHSNARFLSLKLLSSVLIDLSTYGWYINYSFDMAQVSKLKLLLDGGYIDAIDELMKSWVLDNWKIIQNAVIVDHPHRKQPLEQAFYAHDKGLYSLSIPVFFAQIDGICGELTGFKFFLNKKEDKGVFKPKVGEWAAPSNKLDIHHALCAALLYKGAFQLHQTETNKISFTRHSVLHGETNNYGTEMNSIKAVSLLAYINDVCSKENY